MRPDELLLLNAFSDRLSPLGFNLFSIFLPDLMHKVELGGWKVIFIHLLRMLQSIGEEWLVELDRRCVWCHTSKVKCTKWCSYRFQEIPSFRRDTIHKFSMNVLELKKVITLDFKNLLQVRYNSSLQGSMFNGLYPVLYTSLWWIIPQTT